MSDGPGNVAQPIQYGDIVFAEVSHPNGLNPKIRRVVVLTPDTALAAGYPIVVVGVTGTLPDPLPRPNSSATALYCQRGQPCQFRLRPKRLPDRQMMTRIISDSRR
jgi:mRNA-degrading endonuclease toxin of MazEF toxin-antitoxin module